MNILQSVKTKLLAIVFGAILALCAFTIIALMRMNVDMQKYATVIQVDEYASQLAQQANLEFKTQVQEWKNVLIRGKDSDQMDKYWGQFNSQHDTVQEIIKELIPLLPSGGEAADVAKQFLSDHQAMKIAYTDGRNKFINAGFNVTSGDQAVSGIDRAPSAALDQIVNIVKSQIEGKMNALAKSSKRDFRFRVITMLCAVLFIGVVSLLVIDRMIVRPLSRVTKSLTMLGQGDLSMACDYVNDDEIGKIAGAARLVHSFLTRNMETMKSTSEALTRSSQHLSTMSEDLSKQSQEQSSATEQVATAIQEMTHSAEEVANNSALTSDITKATAGKSAEGAVTVESAKNKSIDLVTDLNKSAAVIRELAENANNVSSVLDVIRAIADQTNLLALNAAIEAARAGEHGRGFAVVADEVRTLAQRTQDSTTEIEGILDSVKTGADNAVLVMDKGQISSKQTEEDITKASNSLQEIAAMITDINEKNVQIATASKEQTEVATGISSLVHDIQGLAEATSARVEQTQEISKELDVLIREFDQQIAMFRL